MTRFRFNPRFPRAAFFSLVLLAGCATSSGRPAAGIAEANIAPAYLPLVRHFHLGLDTIAGSAVVIAPGIAATNAHNHAMVAPAAVLGTARDYDLMFFRAGSGRPAYATAGPAIGAAVTAYGQGAADDLRVAHGVVREIFTCPGCSRPAYFVFANDKKSPDDAGPGFSGGPVMDAQGRLVGIVFGYKDEGGRRLVYAYDMARVRAELDKLSTAAR